MAAAKRNSTVRSSRNKTISYRQSSSDECSDSCDEFQPLQKKTRFSSVLNKASIPSRHTQAKTSQKLPQQGPTENQVQIDSDGVIPPWTSLPYEILFSIFKFALDPLRDADFQKSPVRGWALSAARTNKAFMEPALAAFYENPPLAAPYEMYQLRELLHFTPDSLSIDYRTKIKRLELDLRQTLAGWSSSLGRFDLASIIPYLPNLAAVNITSDNDRAPYRQIINRWVYPPSLFLTLQENKVRLRSWCWNNSMIGDLKLEDIHSSAPFRSLQKLALSHLGEEVIEHALTPLAELRSLTLSSCHSKDWAFLSSHPARLAQLTVINCRSFDSRALDTYLANYGGHMKELILDHNPSLNLAFLPHLKSSCPELRMLKMDLTYYSTINNDAALDPLFQSLLDSGQYPTWPSKLQTLEMLHLRRWTSDAAETFFTSLIRAAEELQFLRQLVIKAILNISWRDRAGFREYWISWLTKVFLRKSADPNPDLASFRAFRTSKESNAMKKAQFCNKADHVSGSCSAIVVPANGTSRPSRATSVRRKSQRIKKTDVEKTPGSGYGEDEMAGNGSESEAFSRNEWRNSEHIYVHGLCEVVDVTIDNLRPREMRFNEDDFMDSELSGDDEWTGDNELPSSDRHAW